MAPRSLSRRLHRPVRGARIGLCLCLLLAWSGSALACNEAPHDATQMPESLSNHWLDPGGSLAWYDGPTTRYPHGVLGDAIEATELHAYSEASRTTCDDHVLILPEDLVFEDIAPRLVDLDGDNMPEIIVVQSHQRLGAQLAVYRAADDGIGFDLLATTPFIGRPNRWLAPIGAADLDGDGMIEIAYIDRPHLSRILRVWRYVPGGLHGQDRLVEVAALAGLSNHRIGEDFISGGLRDCGAGPELITANADWSQVMATRMDNSGLQTRALAPWSAASLASAMACTL